MTAIGRSLGIDDPDAMKKMVDPILPNTLLKRVGQPDDIANLVSFLASDEDARNITGSIFVNDSGYLIHPPNINREQILQESATAVATKNKK